MVAMPAVLGVNCCRARRQVGVGGAGPVWHLGLDWRREAVRGNTRSSRWSFFGYQPQTWVALEVFVGEFASAFEQPPLRYKAHKQPSSALAGSVKRSAKR